MSTESKSAIASGAAHVEQTEHLAAHLTEPKDPAILESLPEDATDNPPVETELGALQLSMFEQGGKVRVRVGNPHNSSELYEQIYESADEANDALLDGGILTDVPDRTLLAGTGVQLEGITKEQLEAAGLKRHGSPTYGGRQ